QKFIICAELPGVSLDDVNVEIKHDRLTIEGDRRPEPQHEPDEQRRSERSYGHFYRVVALPPGAQPEGASASMQDGLLEITVPLSAHPYQTRRIDVRPKQERNA
ncbi:MAG TPA: Hsp20/alpha crystallin family protein, partial [Noviherbaspirillum sp.]|nr:Hsp20/alpha crystallin family protein [Noviherbaspirillum sp.]